MFDPSVPSFDSLGALPDRPALEQLARALWSRGALRGAAVLVGAGVSRGGAELLSSDARPPPLWGHLADGMARELYGTQTANAPSDPLRLAEEFRAGLGNAALIDFLRRHICDDALEPGSIHHSLLELPWADVLTTNYDTLLERAAKNARRGYDFVLSESDLAHAEGPRIIKLHGSLRDGGDVIISEEDYRTYPQRRAAFVNTARQVFIENELCLLGFSGDDPNFLQWAGWVRDRLGGESRRIYLVGAFDLPPVKRRLLEERGVAPIDLSPAVVGERDDQRHAAAISLFLRYLMAARPPDPSKWEPAPSGDYVHLTADHRKNDLNDPEYASRILRDAVALWRDDRLDCPDWLVLPTGRRLMLRVNSKLPINCTVALDSLHDGEQRDALLEWAWRHDRGAQPLMPWLAERMDLIATPEMLADAAPELIRALARVLLSAARADGDGELLATRAARFESLTAPNDIYALCAHERCLFAFERLDFAFVAENLSKIDGDDPVWGLRRAALLYWVGDEGEALMSISAAIRELRARVLRDPDSVALRSRIAWAKMLAQALRAEDGGTLFAELDGLDHLALRNYDPWEQLGALDREVDDGLRKRLEARPIEPGFDAGTYRDTRNSVEFRSAAMVTPLGELRHIAERTGLPVRTSHVNVLGVRLANALRLSFVPTAGWHTAFLATKPSYSKGPINIHLGRIPIARLSASAVTELREQVKNAVSFWCDRVRHRESTSNDVDALRLYVEVLSRLAPRDDADTAKAHVKLAVDLGADRSLRHWWLNEPIGHLLKRAFGAVPSDERSELSRELLCFPLAAERDVAGPSLSWYDPSSDAYRFVRRGGNESIFDDRVATFIRHLSGDGASRPEAAVRLLCLHENGQLTDDQAASFAEALWKDVLSDGNKLPEGTNLFSYAFLIAPAPPEVNSYARVYANLFSAGEGADPSQMVAAASGPTPDLQPNEEDAVRLFGLAAGWRPATQEHEAIGEAFTGPYREENDRIMASILGIVAAPALAQYDRTPERAEAALTFLNETDLPEALAALPVFYGLNSDINRRIVDAFRRPLSVGDRRMTPVAVNALDRWLRQSEDNSALPIPDAIRNRLLRALERGRMSGLPNLIYLARRLVEGGHISGSHFDQLVEVLNELRAASDYGTPDGDADVDSNRAVSLPLVRAECVRLAQALEDKGVTTEQVRVWRAIAERDPLPEVRNALNSGADL